MTNSQRLAMVRARFLAFLCENERANGSHQGSFPDPAILSESILIRDDFYCGRRFHASDYHAVWFIEPDELKIYRRGGELVRVLSQQQIDCPSADFEGSGSAQQGPGSGQECPESGSERPDSQPDRNLVPFSSRTVVEDDSGRDAPPLRKAA